MTEKEIFALSSKEKLFKHLYNNHISIEELVRTGTMEQVAKTFDLSPLECAQDPTMRGCINNSYTLEPPKGKSLFVVRGQRYQPPHLCRMRCIDMMYVYSGNCRFIVKHTEYCLQQGDLCIFPPFPRMSYALNHDDDVIFSVAFWPETFRSILMNQNDKGNKLTSYFHHIFDSANLDMENTPFFTIRTDKQDGLHELFAKIWQEERCRDAHSDLMQLSLFNQICVQILRKYSERILLPANLSQQSTAEAVISFVEHNCASTSLAETAAHFNYTPSYLCRLIKNKTGQTFTDILHNARMRRAIQLLCFQNWSIDGIAIHVGYSSLTTFYRQFKKRMGRSPAEYRKELRQESPDKNDDSASF